MELRLSQENKERQQHSFGAVIRGDTLEVPAAIYGLAQACRLETASELAEHACRFPVVFVRILGWSQEQLMDAREELILLIAERVELALPDYLLPNKPQQAAILHFPKK